MSTALLTTKFYIPPAPPNDLPRQRLFDRLDRVTDGGRRLALICAPAGYGKTTLVADWLRRAGLPAAWLSLEESENDLQTFLLYLVASAQRLLPAGDEEIALLLQSVSPDSPQTALAGLINRLSTRSEQLVLVLDDYQVIHTAAVHEAVIFLVEHLPPNAHLAITARSDPPLPLHRYRARDQMVEIRLDELSMTEAEAGNLLAGEPYTGLGAAETSILVERTEGWPAGIQMALLALRGKTDAAGFIHSWNGSLGTKFRGYILDYLAEEVLKSQPEPIQQFLVQTSALDRFNAELCSQLTVDSRQLTARTDVSSANCELSTVDCQLLLENLLHANLFIIPLDEEGYWFRYHHLFLDLLRMRLKQMQQRDPEAVRGLHRRAAHWLEAHGWLREAIQHAISAGDYAAAAELVEQHTFRLFSEGELHALVAWVRLLPAELARSRPWLSIYQAWALGFAGQLQSAWELCQGVEDMLQKQEFPATELQALAAELTGIRAMTNVMAGRFREVLELETLPADAFPASSQFARSAVCWALGFTWRMQGELRKATVSFEEMRRIGLQTGNNWTILSASVDLGTALRQAGRLREAEEVYRAGLERVQQSAAGGAGFIGRLESFLANVLYEKDELDEAERLARSSIHHNRYWENANHTAHAYYTLARICLAKRERDAAALAGGEEALQAAERAARLPGVVPSLKAIIAALRVRFWLAQGNLAEAARWLDAHPEDPARRGTEMGEVLETASARALFALGKPTEALNLLSEAETAARSGEHTNALIEILTLKAAAAHRPSDLLEALALGCPHGYVRIFLDEGNAMERLLAETLPGLKHERAAVPDTHRLVGYIERLLAAFRTAALGSEPDAPQTGKEVTSLLTERELEILRAIAAGLTNQLIGRKLYISAGTVKAHSAAIYRKLDVANRTEAIAKAKDMGLL